MANNESTAVNDLIALVNQPPSARPPTEELNFDARPAPRQATRTMQPMTLDAAMEPMPRSRAPHSTAMPVPTRRSTAVPPPRPSTQMAAAPPPIPGRPSAQFAVPTAPATLAPPVPVVAPAPIAATPVVNVGMLTEPIEQYELSDDDDDDDDAHAFDGDPEAPVPTTVMAQAEVEMRAESTRLDQGWTPNAQAPLTLDGSELGGGETTPFLTDEPTEEAVRRPAPAFFEDSAILSSAALKRPTASVAAVRAVSPAPGTLRAVSPAPGTLRAVSPAPALLAAADLPPLPKAKPSAALDVATPATTGPLPWASNIAPNNATEANWFEASRAVPQVDLVPIVPPRVPRPETTTFEKVKRAMPIVSGLAVVGFFVGGYLYFNSSSVRPQSNESAKATAVAAANPATGPGEPAVAAPVAAEPAVPAVPVAAEPAVPTVPVAVPAVAAPVPVEPVAPAPIAAEPAVAAPLVAAALVDVRFDSVPAGATVTLVDRGHTSLIGATPITAALDPSHTYDIVFSLDGRATTMATLDPSKSKAVRTVLPAIGSSNHSSVNSVSRNEAAMPAVAAAPKSSSKSRSTKETPSKAVKTVATTAPTETPVKGGEGVVMISSKPPCEIFVDGKDTGMMTPQRNITLRAGAHTITLVSKVNGIKKNVAVQVVAGKSTKLVQDYSALIKK